MIRRLCERTGLFHFYKDFVGINFRKRAIKRSKGTIKDTLTLWNGLWLDLHIQDSLEHERWVVRHEGNKVKMDETQEDSDWSPE